MDRQGRFHEELKRTRSWHYAHCIVDGANRLATIAECVDRDLWGHRLSDWRGLADAHGFLAPYQGKETQWPFPDRDHAACKFDTMERRAAEVDWITLRGTLPANRPQEAVAGIANQARNGRFSGFDRPRDCLQSRAPASQAMTAAQRGLVNICRTEKVGTDL